ncbi:hypothetical protein GGU10DRAFT_360146 [Lentinula aff. detonsa]|uniref:Uncharacterized protein n=1 Tax=Lentinula aff. detonsa TaxID=2804958 RepID=A0AA38KYK7_9AGAR|nr:hypothetical protein GGU10DRAFT_360146 [Lentinula aff. detonsa]
MVLQKPPRLLLLIPFIELSVTERRKHYESPNSTRIKLVSQTDHKHPEQPFQSTRIYRASNTICLCVPGVCIASELGASACGYCGWNSVPKHHIRYGQSLKNIWSELSEPS